MAARFGSYTGQVCVEDQSFYLARADLSRQAKQSGEGPPQFVEGKLVMGSNDVAQVGDPKEVGQWGALFDLPNVPIHTHVLPTGKVLFWGRRNPPGTTSETSNFPSLNQHATQALIWDPANPNAPARSTSYQPTNSRNESINLFCSGHTFMADGRLLVTGGHIFDSQGISSSTFYDPFKDRWSPGPDMGTGRWYPTAVTLPDGRAFALSGSHATGIPAPPPKNFNTLTNIPQVLDNGQWLNVTDFVGLPLFPRLHVAPNGFLFMSGPLAMSYFLKNFEPQNTNAWAPVAARVAAFRDYAPSVMYNVGKVIFIGVNSLETGDRNFLPSLFHLAGAFTALARDVGPGGNGLHAALGGGNTMPLTAFYSAGGKLLDVERGALVPVSALKIKIAQLFGITN